MTQSRITSKNQTTVPREVRERLGVGPSDVLEWQIVAGGARVVPATRRFLERRGTVHVGRGSVTDDVRRARRLRGTAAP
jgi:bifunctional DNA-binding transcriptional regulator/antitoxin component of YhaV-PrlF toxin-antitoxin module